MITDDELRAMEAAALKRGDYTLANECDFALGSLCTALCGGAAACTFAKEVRDGLEHLRDARRTAASTAQPSVTDLARPLVDELFDLGGES